MTGLTQKIYICGVVGSGKSLLKPLLDGHPKVLTFPFQGIGMSLLGTRFAEYCQRVRLYTDFQHMGLSEHFVCVIDGKEIRIPVSDFITFLFSYDSMSSILNNAVGRYVTFQSTEATADSTTGTEFDFDFFIFLKTLTSSLIEGQYFPSVEHLQEAVYQCVYQNWRDYQGKDTQVENFALSSRNGIDPIKEIMKKNEMYKILVVLRDPVSISFTNTRRMFAKKSPDGENITKHKRLFLGIYDRYESTLYTQSFIRKVKDFQSYVCEISDQNRNMFLVEFSDLVYKTEETMESVLGFLSLQSNPVVYEATINSRRIETESVRFIGTVNDDPEKNLTAKQIAMLKYFYTRQISPGMGIIGKATLAVSIVKWKIIWWVMKLRVCR